MAKEWLVVIIFGGIGAILFGIGLFLKQRNDRKKNHCTLKTTGEVIDYTFSSNNGIRPPVVEFAVNGETFTSKLQYTAVSNISGSWIKETKIKGDKLDHVLKVKQNKHFSRNPMAGLFPLGSKLTVFYDPENPKKNYVERLAPNMIDKIFMGCGMLIWVAGIILYFVLRR